LRLPPLLSAAFAPAPFGSYPAPFLTTLCPPFQQPNQPAVLPLTPGNSPLQVKPDPLRGRAFVGGVRSPAGEDDSLYGPPTERAQRVQRSHALRRAWSRSPPFEGLLGAVTRAAGLVGNKGI